MDTLIKQTVLKQPAPKTTLLNRIITHYLTYAENESKNRVLWYCKTLLVLPCIIMVPALIAMAMLTPAYVWFIAVLILLFYANVLAHVAQTSGRIFVPLYHATIIAMFLIPFITYIIL